MAENHESAKSGPAPSDRHARDDVRDFADREWVRQMAERWGSPEYDSLISLGKIGDKVSGHMSFLFELALSTLMDGESPLNLMYVTVPAPTLNAFTTRSRKTGTFAVVANLGMFDYIGSAVHLALGLCAEPSRDGTNEYCRHAGDGDRFAAYDELAELLLETRPAAAARNPAVRCIGVSGDHPLDHVHDTFSKVAELCVLLHELGHMALGHLSEANGTHNFGSTGGEVIEFAHQRELEADLFAMERACGLLVPGGLEPGDVVFAFGCFLALAHVCEELSTRPAITTHPPAMVRWRVAYAWLGEVRQGSMVFKMNHLMSYFAIPREQRLGPAPQEIELA